MGSASQWTKRYQQAGLMALPGIVAGIVLWSGNGKDGQLALGPHAGGDARSVGFEPYPMMDSMMCQMVPASVAFEVEAIAVLP